MYIRQFASCVWGDGLPLPFVGKLKCQNKHQFTGAWALVTAGLTLLPVVATSWITRRISSANGRNSKLTMFLSLIPFGTVVRFWVKHAYAAFGLGPAPPGIKTLCDAPRKEGVEYVRFVVISDTHNKHDDLVLPDGDVLLHCGDFTVGGTRKELESFNNWLGEHCSKFKRRIVIAGNHDLCLDPDVDDLVWEQFVQASNRNKRAYAIAARSLLTNCEYLEDEEAKPERGIRIYGAPWTPIIAPPDIYVPWAFNRDPVEVKMQAQPRPFSTIKKTHEPLIPVSLTSAVDSLEECWARIPNGVDILMTHGPPKGRCDKCWNQHGGDPVLLAAVERVAPRFHIFGHLHESYGTCTVGPTTFINASSTTFLDDVFHRPVVFDVPVKTNKL